jgi:hypothetical protein
VSARRTRRDVGLGVILLFACPAPATSQIPAYAPVAVGSPLRVTPIHGPQQTARFESQSDAGLQVRLACDAGCQRLSTTAWSDLRRVDVLVRGPGSPQRALIGGLIGGAATFVVLYGVAAAAPPCYGEELSCPSVGIVLAAPAIASGGALLGAVVGWTTSRDRWETVWSADTIPESR